jgi:fatty-acyl-CoA synthase
MRLENVTLQHVLINSLSKFRDRIFAKIGDNEYSYLDVHLGSNRVSNAIKEAGFGPGDRIGMIMVNSIELIYSTFGVYKAGAASIIINALAMDKDIEYIINDAKVKLLIIDSDLLDRVLSLKSKCPTLGKIVVAGAETNGEYTSFEEFQGSQPDTTPELNAKPDDDAWLVYTGGTTGKSKGVVHTHGSVWFFVMAQCAGLNWLQDDCLLLVTPLGHAAGALVFGGMAVGCKFIIRKKFDLFEILEILEKEKVKKVFLVPTLIYILLDLLKQKKYDLSSLNSIIYGAAPISSSRLSEAIDQFGPILMQIYGQTECSFMISALSIEDHITALKNPELLRSCGRPGIMVNLKILDDDDKEVKTGEVGEICIQAPFIMKGYLNLPELTSQTLKNGWLHTGDMGKVDEGGYVYIVDRKKDMIISGGMNIYPAEVEDLISRHPKVKQVTVIGIPDEKWGEAVTAVIIRDGELTEQDIKNYCRDKLSKYAQPKNVIFQEQLPLTLLGKVDKKALRAPFWEGKERAIH